MDVSMACGQAVLHLPDLVVATKPTDPLGGRALPPAAMLQQVTEGRGGRRLLGETQRINVPLEVRLHRLLMPFRCRVAPEPHHAVLLNLALAPHACHLQRCAGKATQAKCSSTVGC